MDESFLQESLQHPGSKGRVPSNQRQLFLDQEIFDQQERHILHPVILTCVTLFDIVLRRELIKETRVALLTRTEISQMWHKPNLAVKGISIFFEVWRSLTQVRYLTAWISQFSPCATTRWTLTSDQRPVLRFSITELLVCGRRFLPEEGLFFRQVFQKKNVEFYENPRLLKRELSWHGLVGQSEPSQRGIHWRGRTQHWSPVTNMKLHALLVLVHERS